MSITPKRFACPCCGLLTLDEEPPGTYDICRFCGWEDDPVQFRDPDFEGGANEPSLNQARAQLGVNYADLLYSDDRRYRLGDLEFSGCALERSPTGAVEMRIRFLNGLEHGPAEDYYPTGRLKGQTGYEHGLKHGPAREWAEDGTLTSERRFEWDVLMVEKALAENGALQEVYRRPEEDPLFALVAKRRGQAGN